MIDADAFERYGYAALFLGGVLEGETVFILAGYAISQDLMHPLPAFLSAVAGAASGDCLYFVLGRRYGARLFAAFPFLRRLRPRAALLFRRWGRATAFLARFAYGLRLVLPMSMGAARFSPLTFVVFDLLGAVAFATLYLSLGYLFGETMEELLGRMRANQGWILLALAVMGAAIWIVREWQLFHAREGMEREEADSVARGVHPAPPLDEDLPSGR